MKIKDNLIFKVVTIVFFIVISTALILTLKNPSQGYELSIYNTIPTVWRLLSTVILGGISIVVIQLAKEDYKKNSWWHVGLTLIILSNLVIILQPILRGYFLLGRSDNLVHFRYLMDILKTGFFASRDVYPIIHILMAQSSLLLNIPPNLIMNLIPSYYYLLFVIFSYLLSKEILLKQEEVILATTASTVLFSYYYIEVFPQGSAFTIFPLFFFLYFKAVNHKLSRFRILLICLVILMVFFHPVASFLLLISVLTMKFTTISYNKLLFYKGRSTLLPFSSQSFPSMSLIIPLISFIVLLLWIWGHYEIWNFCVLNVVNWFNNEFFGNSMLESGTEAFSKLNLGLWETLELIIRSFGHVAIYLLFSVVAVLIILAKKKPYLYDLKYALPYGCFFLIISVIQSLDFVRPVTSLTSGRVLGLLIALFPPLMGLALYYIMNPNNMNEKNKNNFKSNSVRKKICYSLFVGFILIFSSLIGIFSIYPSPLTSQPNQQITYMELNGETWLYNNRNSQFEVLTSTRKFEYAIVGFQENYFQFYASIPYHFNYNQYNLFGESFPKKKYVPLSKYDKLLYTTVWSSVGRFKQEDFVRLEKDHSVDKVYVNGEIEINMLNPAFGR